MAREKALDNKVLKFFKSKGFWCVKYWAGAKFTKTGIPDILACVGGYFFGIEDKAENGKPTLLQLVNLEKIRNAGGYGILLYPGDYESFTCFISQFYTDDENIEAWDWYRQNLELQRDWFKKLKE